MSALSKEVRSFIEIARERSFRGAAEKLNISASALSRQIQILERDFGTPLLIRLSKSIQLTDAGRNLLFCAGNWLAEENQLRTSIKTINHTQQLLEINIGVMECLSTTVLPKIHSELTETFGEICLHSQISDTQSLVKLLLDGKLDIIIAFNVHHSEQVQVISETDCKIGLIHPSNLLPKKTKTLPLSECLAWPLCLPDHNLSFQPRLYAEILRQKIDFNIVATSNSVALLRELVYQGNGVSFMTWYDVESDIKTGRLGYTPVNEKRLQEKLCTCIASTTKIDKKMSLVLDKINLLL